MISSSASRFEKERGSQVFPPSFVSAKEPRAPTMYPWEGESKSMAKTVSWKGMETRSHCLLAAAEAAEGSCVSVVAAVTAAVVIDD